MGHNYHTMQNAAQQAVYHGNASLLGAIIEQLQKTPAYRFNNEATQNAFVHDISSVFFAGYKEFKQSKTDKEKAGLRTRLLNEWAKPNSVSAVHAVGHATDTELKEQQGHLFETESLVKNSGDYEAVLTQLSILGHTPKTQNIKAVWNLDSQDPVRAQLVDRYTKSKSWSTAPQNQPAARLPSYEIAA